MLVFPLSLRNILQPAHKIGACIHPILVPHQTHPEKRLSLKELMTMNYFYSMQANHLTHTETQWVSKRKSCASKQGVFFRARTQKKLL